MFFLSMHHMIPSDNLLDYSKQALHSDVFEAFLFSSIWIKLYFACILCFHFEADLEEGGILYTFGF